VCSTVTCGGSWCLQVAGNVHRRLRQVNRLSACLGEFLGVRTQDGGASAGLASLLTGAFAVRSAPGPIHQLVPVADGHACWFPTVRVKSPLPRNGRFRRDLIHFSFCS
jgi:hypothetical protein